MDCRFRYNTDLFDEATVERMADHLRTMLEAAAADPDRRLSDLPILTESERHRLIVEWNDTSADYASDACVHELFRAQARANARRGRRRVRRTESSPTASSTRRPTGSPTICAAWASGPDVLVGICAGRSPELVVGLLGVLKAGGAYVPLDPAYPTERLAFMLEDSGGAGPADRKRRLLRQPAPARGPGRLPGPRLEAIAAAPETAPGERRAARRTWPT